METDETITPAQTSPQTGIHVLILDDEPQFTDELKEFFLRSGWLPSVAHTGPEGLQILRLHGTDLLILDIRLPEINGLEVLKIVKNEFPDLEVIVVSGHGDMDTVISAMRMGAIDYLRKPFRLLDLQLAIERSKKYLRLKQNLREAKLQHSLISETLERRIKRNFIGISPEIRRVFELARVAAQFSETNVLITGESGTGKENIARIIHYESARKEFLLVTVNSSAINESLMESEFFGHRKGSFTGALQDKKGFFEVSDRGTLFLDEIADMPMTLQAKVLRAIEEKQITRVGETQPIHTDFRIISATNHPIEQLADEKKFRLDLLHRLNTLHIHIPPLRERPDDVEPLLKHFLSEFSKRTNKPVPSFHPAVIRELRKYPFPGNVRELKNMAERAVILSGESVLQPSDFILPGTEAGQKALLPGCLNLREQEVSLIRRVLKNSGYNQKAAADQLGITRDALSRKMKKYHILIHRSENSS